MKLRELSAEEWFHIRTLRGVAMTGHQPHRTKQVPIDPKFPSYVKGVGKTYYWPMGEQPGKDVLDLIAKRCPVKAAEAYLAVFEKNDPKKWMGNYARPVLRKGAAV